MIRRLLTIGLIAAATLSAAPTRAQTVDDLRLLPPIGSTDSAVVPDEIVAAGEVVQTSPVITDEAIVVDDSTWVPTTWFASPVWKFSAELGLNGSSGNAEAFSFLAGADAKRETEGNTFEWNLKYGKTRTSGLETQHFALLNSRWDLNMTPVWFLYNKNSLEYDEFKAFDVRLAMSTGVGRHLIKNDITTFTARAGAGFSREFGGPADDFIPEANMGIDYEHQLTKRQRIKLTSDYYPSWEDFQDYRLVSDGFWEITLDEAAGLSLKMGMVDRYDSTPNGRKHNDIDYFVTLMWKR